MLRIAGQTAGPIGLKFFVDIHGRFFFHGQRRALQLVYYNIIISIKIQNFLVLLNSSSRNKEL